MLHSVQELMAPFLGASFYQTFGVHHNVNSGKKEKRIMSCEIMILFLFGGDVERCPSRLRGQTMVDWLWSLWGMKKVIAVGFTFNFLFHTYTLRACLIPDF